MRGTRLQATEYDGLPARASERLLGYVLTLCLALGANAASPASADAIRLSLPVDCKIGETCFIQNYMDVDPNTGAKDFRCGAQTYDGHKGTDFRLLSTRVSSEGVPVLAAAPGLVRAVRDGMPDRLVSGPESETVRGRECGNGVVIDHGQGWETQYCHLRSGSARVRKGQQVARGEPIGAVGFSGKTQFAHLHLSVRKAGSPVDPFTGRLQGEGCPASPILTLWDAAIVRGLAYKEGELLEAGIAARPVTAAELELGAVADNALALESPAALFYARFINLQQGDRVRLSLSGPSGSIADRTTQPLDSKKAQYVAYVGKKRRTGAWQAGQYKGSVQLLRAGKIILDRSITHVIR